MKIITTRNHKRGFTLIELLVVIAIVGILTSILFVSAESIRDNGREGATLRQLQVIKNAITTINLDTNFYPNNLSYLCEPLDEISETNEYAISHPNAGLISNGRGWPGWSGPYIQSVPTDPWGNEYYFDDDYRCLAEVAGCNGITDPSGVLNSSVIVSCGPNGAVSGGACSYDTDNIVVVLCTR